MPPVTHRPSVRHQTTVKHDAPAAIAKPAPIRTDAPAPKLDAYDPRHPVIATPAGKPVADPELDILARTLKARGENVVGTIAGPSASTATSITFDFGPNGRVMQPGEVLMLGIPAEWKKRLINTVTLVHRQDAASDTGLDEATGRDERPGLTAVNLHSADDGTWRKWNCPWGGNGKWGAKFAERRPENDPEFESMFEWHIQGHANADKEKSAIKHTLRPNGVRVACVGDDPVIVHKLILDFIGERPTRTLDATFSPGTDFGDWETGEGRKFGGGQEFGGTYPGALELGSTAGGAGAGKLPAGWKVRGGMLEVPLEPGKVITGVDLACGDSKQDGLRNKDGGWGTSGHARLSMGIKDAHGKVAWFVDRIGVPPQGVMSGAPAEKNFVTRPGDSLVFRAEVDPVHVMAARVGLRDSAG